MIIKFENAPDKDRTRLDSFIAKYFNTSRSKLEGVFKNNLVFVNKKNQKASYNLKHGDLIEFSETEINKFLNPDKTLVPYDFKLDIIYEDDDLAVINKPKEMLTHPTAYDREKTLVNALLSNFKNLSDIAGADRQGIIHRLDKNTSGLIIIAKTNEAHENLALQIKEKKAKRKYRAIALGTFEKREGIIDKPLVHYIKNNVKMEIAKEGQGLEAITHYKVLEEYKGAALVELELKTGRTHQIRAHLASINHPVFGDSLYGAKSFMRNEFYNLKTVEQLLQSYYISFYHPKTNEPKEFILDEKDYCKDFIKVLNFLRNKEKKNEF